MMRLRGIRSSTMVATISSVAIACAVRAQPVVGQRPSRPVAALTVAEQTIMAAALDSIAAAWPDSTTLCLRVLGGPGGWEMPPERLLRVLRMRQRPVSSTRCPRTYTSMVVRVDSLGRRIDERAPQGYVDPYVLSVGRPQMESDSYGWVHVRELQGTAGRAYLCTVQYVRRLAWAHCETLSRWVH